MTKSWQVHKERSTPLALKIIRWIAQNLGRPFARTLLYPITLYFLVFASAQRKASLLYLSKVLNRKPNWLDVARHIHPHDTNKEQMQDHQERQNHRHDLDM